MANLLEDTKREFLKEYRELLIEQGNPIEAILREDLTPGKIQDIKKSGIPVLVLDSFVSDWMAVYGTLKVGGVNYKWHLKGKSTYIDTIRMKGYKKCPGLTSTWTGKDEDTTVMDFFKVKPEFMDEVNASIDSLESCYDLGHYTYYCAAAVPVTLANGETVIAKGYPIPGAFTAAPADHDDYNYSSVKHQAIFNYVKETYPDTYINFKNFYKNEDHAINQEA